jgi:hypothetical protein
LLPSDWSILADTNEGLSEGISGQPLYPQDNVYSIKEIYNSSTGVLVGTRYYFWVKNKTLVPANVPGRRLSSASVSALISSPQSSGIPIVALIDKDKFLFYNFDQLFLSRNLFNFIILHYILSIDQINSFSILVVFFLLNFESNIIDYLKNSLITGKFAA